MSEPIQLENVPGGYKSAPDALHALARLSQLLLIARDSLRRLEHAAGSVKAIISAAEVDRKDALRAVELFAEIVPDQLGHTMCDEFSTQAAAVARDLTELELEVADIVRRAGGL